MILNDLTAGYGKISIVKDLTLTINKGEIVSLIGPNGGGKSTLLKTMTGRIKPINGTVSIGNRDLFTIPLSERSRTLSIVTTDRVKPEHMTGLDVVMAGRLPYTNGFGSFTDKDHEAVDKAISLMKVEELADKDFNSLSDGQKQRILIARAICQEPEYLIMDEPTSYLDIRYRMELMDVIRELSDQGTTVIMSLHEPELALRVSDRIVTVWEGGRADTMTPEEVISNSVVKDLYGMTDIMYEDLKAFSLWEKVPRRGG